MCMLPIAGGLLPNVLQRPPADVQPVHPAVRGQVQPRLHRRPDLVPGRQPVLQCWSGVRLRLLHDQQRAAWRGHASAGQEAAGAPGGGAVRPSSRLQTHAFIWQLKLSMG
jgi:hypothetical protein